MSTSDSESKPLFPSIGSLAEQTDDFVQEAGSSQVSAMEDKVVQEIESLCMKCDEQVRNFVRDAPLISKST